MSPACKVPKRTLYLIDLGLKSVLQFHESAGKLSQIQNDLVIPESKLDTKIANVVTVLYLPRS